MKVFISHQRTDTDFAISVAGRLKVPHGIESYLDVIDPDANTKGDKLGEHVRSELSKCTQLLAVVSAATKTSWWVPWEIGLSTEKDQPIATYAKDATTLPEYLKKWPYLKTHDDLDKYAIASKAAQHLYLVRKAQINEAFARQSGTQEFYSNLRASLGQ